MLPCIFRRLNIVKERQIFRNDAPLFDKRIEVHDSAPELLAKEQHRRGLHLAGLDQRECLEQLIQRSVAARKNHERPEQELHLPDREARINKPETSSASVGK